MKKGQEYTGLYKKGFNDLDNYDGVTTHLELDILECEVKWASRSFIRSKISISDGVSDELFQILKMML